MCSLFSNGIFPLSHDSGGGGDNGIVWYCFNEKKILNFCCCCCVSHLLCLMEIRHSSTKVKLMLTASEWWSVSYINFPNVIIHRKPPNSCSSLTPDARSKSFAIFSFVWNVMRGYCALATSISSVVNSHLIWHINFFSRSNVSFATHNNQFICQLLVQYGKLNANFIGFSLFFVFFFFLFFF